MRKIQRKIKSEMAFTVKSQEGWLIQTTKTYWDIITNIKHPSVRGEEKYVKETLASPDEIRISRRDKDIYLFYKKYTNKYLCVVTRIQKKSGFIVTVYYTRKIKEGTIKWKK